MAEPMDTEHRAVQEREQVDRLRAVLEGTTPAERLRWLEQAIEFARRAGALPLKPAAD